MILAALLLLVALVLCWGMPRVLNPLTVRLPPAAAVLVWITTVVAVPAFAGAALLVLLVWPHHAPAEGVLETTARCLAVVVHALQPWLAETVAVLALLVAVVTAIRVSIVGHRYQKSAASMRTYHREVMSVVARTADETDRIMWLDYHIPFAYSIDGRPGIIVATEAIRSLSSAEQNAVLAHERAHLRGRHHLLLRTCSALATALPRVPLFTAAAVALATLVELAADESAATATSRSAMHGALRSVTAECAVPSGPQTVSGHHEIALRLANLDTDPLVCRPPVYAMAFSLTVLLPAVTALIGFSLAALAACLLLVE